MLDHSTIYKFNFGLDTRRVELTGVAGTLIDATDVFVNQGGELEKRKAYVEAYRLPEPVNSVGTFDLLDTEDGLMVFGSALAYGVTPTQSQPNLDSAMPSGVTYQQLKHPELSFDTGLAYSSSYHLMSDVVFSVNFRGKAFVVAEFSDGRLFAFYDGELVAHSVNGIVMQNRTSLASLATDLARQFETAGWSATANVAGDAIPITSITRVGAVATVTTTKSHGYTTGDLVEIIGTTQAEYLGVVSVTVTGATTFTYAVATTPATPATTTKVMLAIKYNVTQNGSVEAKAPAGASFGAVVEETSAAGYMGNKLVATGETSLAGTKAEAKFEITNCSGTFTLEAPSQSTASTPVIDLCGGAVTGLADSAANRIVVANTIVAAVNDLTYAHGYSAFAIGSTVFVYAPDSYSTVTTSFAYNLTVTVTTGTVIASVLTTVGTLYAVIPVNPITYAISRPFAVPISYPASVQVVGGTPPYSYTWAEESTGSGNGIAITGATSVSCILSKTVDPYTTVTGAFKVTVTDSAGVIVVVYLTVAFTNR